MREDLKELKKHVFVGYMPDTNFIDICFGRAKRMPIKQVIESLVSRLDHQEKMQRMILAHLEVEYVKTTEETTKGIKERHELLRKIKKQTK
jgi:hypothetical protein